MTYLHLIIVTLFVFFCIFKDHLLRFNLRISFIHPFFMALVIFFWVYYYLRTSYVTIVGWFDLWAFVRYFSKFFIIWPVFLQTYRFIAHLSLTSSHLFSSFFHPSSLIVLNLQPFEISRIIFLLLQTLFILHINFLSFTSKQCIFNHHRTISFLPF